MKKDISSDEIIRLTAMLNHYLIFNEQCTDDDLEQSWNDFKSTYNKLKENINELIKQRESND